jgi:hypothetical protein
MCLGDYSAGLQMQLQRAACDGGKTGQQAGRRGGCGGDLAHDKTPLQSRVNYLGNNPIINPSRRTATSQNKSAFKTLDKSLLTS